MAKSNAIQTSLQTFGEIARDEEASAESVMVALFHHALECARRNPKASKVALKAHWSTKVVWKGGVEDSGTLTQHYDRVAAKLRQHYGFDDERDGKAVLDACVADGLLTRSRANWVAAPGAFTKSRENATESSDELF